MDTMNFIQVRGYGLTFLPRESLFGIKWPETQICLYVPHTHDTIVTSNLRRPLEKERHSVAQHVYHMTGQAVLTQVTTSDFLNWCARIPR